MYTYEYESVSVQKGLVFARTVDYQEIIARRAKDGWRYVGFIPTAQSGQGLMSEIDLIFEKEM